MHLNLSRSTIIKLVAGFVFILILILGTTYLGRLRYIPIDFETIDAAFSGKISTDGIQGHGMKYHEFEYKKFKGNYEINRYIPDKDSEKLNTVWRTLSDGGQVMFFDWTYSERVDTPKNSKYSCSIRYEKDGIGINITAYCNFPKYEGHDLLFEDIVKSINLMVE